MLPVPFSRRRRSLVAIVAVAVAACAGTPPPPAPPTPDVVASPVSATDRAELVRQVVATERAFAKTMADRDPAAFAGFVAGEAVFFMGATPLRGRDAVAAAWQRFFEKPQAPFSWEPAQVEVLASGNLALSSGPVYNPAGKQVGTFTSIWRLEAPGKWRIVFDRGNDVCDCKAP
jgi:ketosteroid isomerase-like protein